LGLSICKQIMTLHEGEIGCVSKQREGNDVLSGGSEFNFLIKAGLPSLSLVATIIPQENNIQPFEIPETTVIDEATTNSIHVQANAASSPDSLSSSNSSQFRHRYRSHRSSRQQKTSISSHSSPRNPTLPLYPLLNIATASESKHVDNSNVSLNQSHFVRSNLSISSIPPSNITSSLPAQDTSLTLDPNRSTFTGTYPPSTSSTSAAGTITLPPSNQQQKKVIYALNILICDGNNILSIQE
jgi:hypothetical protein